MPNYALDNADIVRHAAERQLTSVRIGLATKSKLCLRNLSSAWG
jgi:hypothetical protein